MGGAALVLGATSSIGRAVARRLARDGWDVALAGRREDELQRIAADLTVRYEVKATVCSFDALDFESHGPLLERCAAALARDLDGIVLCHGVMEEQADAQRDFTLAKRMIDVNYTSAVSILERAASRMEDRGSGFICAISSVAGDRGRPSNYLYGSTKSALSTYLQGLRARLAKAGVGVTDVRPGFVDTGLTWGRPGIFLAADPDAVARSVLRAIRRDKSRVYTPWFWAGIMAIIRAVPDRVFKRLSL